MNRLIIQPCMGFKNKISPGVFEGVFGIHIISSFRYKKFKMANPICLSTFIKIDQTYLTTILDSPF